MSVLITASKLADKGNVLYGKTHSNLSSAKIAVMEHFTRLMSDPEYTLEGGGDKGVDIAAVYSALEMKNSLAQVDQRLNHLMSVK